MTDTITRDIHLSADVDEVWAAVTDPEQLTEWLADEVALELVPGGSAEFVVRGERRDGWVEEITPPGEHGRARLAFWWQGDDEPASQVCFELTPDGAGTRLRVRETRPLELLDLVSVPLRGGGSAGPAYGPALVAAAAR